MATQLVTVKNTNGTSKTVQLDMDSTLADVRCKLTERGIMAGRDRFLFNEAEIDTDDEPATKLSQLEIEHNTFNIGTNAGSGIRVDEEVEDYRDLTENQKADLFNKCQILKGLVFREGKGVVKSFEDLYSWKSGYLPDALMPSVNTEEFSGYSFSKITHDLTLISNDKTTVALDVPFVKVDAEYEHEKSKTSGSSVVKEYLLAKYVISKAVFNIDVSKLAVKEGFVKAVHGAIMTEDSDKDKMCNLLHVLDEWGLYIPQRFTLGGALYSTEETTISDYTQSGKEKESFAASVKAEYLKASGSVSYSGSKEKKEEGSSSTKYKNISINQIGGKPGQQKNDSGLAASLNWARYWALVNVEKFYPSIMLLQNACVPGTDPYLLRRCLQLMNNNFFHGAVKKIQPYINMSNYATSIEGLLE